MILRASNTKSLLEYPLPQTKAPASAPHLPNNILALYLGQQALERCGESVLCSCMPAPASSGEVVKISRGAGFWVTMGFYGHVKSRYTFWGYLGPFASSGESCQSSPELAGAGYAITSNRITAQVLVIYIYTSIYDIYISQIILL